MLDEGGGNKLLIIGLDGLDWRFVDPLLDAGVMPNLARLRREGAWGPLTSVIPTQSATAWASFITGQNPARHGVFDFVVRQSDGTYRHARPRPADTLWRHLSNGGVRVGVVNFPVTYPPDPVNGFLVSGMLTPKGRTFTFPPSLGDEILGQVPGYRLDLEWELYRGRDRALISDIAEMTRARLRAIRMLRDAWSPDCLAVVFVGPDRLQHGMLRHLDPAHPNHDRAEASALMGLIHEFYGLLDEAVGTLVAEAGERTTVLILSDHGFQSVAWQFRTNEWLAQRGWLAWQTGRSRFERLVRRIDTPWVQHIRRRLVKDVSRFFPAFAPGGTLDRSRTVAFSPWNRQQGIRINVRGRDPHGVVAPGAEYERLRWEIREALAGATDPRTGERVVDQIWAREELFDGPFLQEVPDLVFELRPSYTASPVQQGLWTSTGWATGDHSLTGILIAWGWAVAPGRVEGARLIDLAPTALYLMGQPVPQAMDGRVLTGALDPRFVSEHPLRYVQGEAPGTPQIAEAQEAMTAEEEADIQSRLRGLGYL